MKKIVLSLLIGLFFVMPVAAQEEEIGLKIGIPAPDFEAVTHDGKTIKLSEINKKGPVVLIFYRGGWCVYCNRHLQDIQSRLSEIEELDSSIIAISVDLPENAAKTVEEKKLGFPVISNPQANLIELYNLVYKVPPEKAKMYKEKYKIDLEAASGRSDYLITIPATYIVDQDGQIVFAYANRDYKVRKTPDEILEALHEVVD